MNQVTVRVGRSSKRVEDAMASSPGTLSIDGKDYVVLPKADYLRLVGKTASAKLEDARGALREVYGDPGPASTLV
jgi:hypothetical protein